MKVPQAGQRVSGGKERSKKVKDGPLTEAVQSNYNNRIVELALFVFDAGISLFRSCSPPADQGGISRISPSNLLRNADGDAELESWKARRRWHWTARRLLACLP